MIDNLYELTAQIGYTHPLHPALTHLPIGGVMVAFFLALAGLLFKKNSLFSSAYHAVTVAIIFLIPTVIAGVLDWQRYYGGAWLFPIQIKMALATTLLFLLSITLLVGRKPNAPPVLMMSLYTLCLMNVAGIGYFGGELVFGNHAIQSSQNVLITEPPSSTKPLNNSGETLFTGNCSGCHINGGNVIRPDLPLHSSQKLQTFATFITFIRNPTLPDGTKGPMPDFPAEKLSEQQARDLYDYIVNRLAKSKSLQK